MKKGIKGCKKCLLILSPNFLSNKGWTKREFDLIFTREILEESNIVLPVWHEISSKEIYEYSPSLADKVGIRWDLDLEEVCRKLYKAIMN